MRFAILSMSLWVLALPLLAQANKTESKSPFPPSFIFERLDIESGNASRDIWRMMKDQQGFMWFATVDGLDRFDGKTIKTFKIDPLDSASLPNNRIWEIYEDVDGKFLIGTGGGGLTVFNPRKEQFSPFKWRDSVYLNSGVIFRIMRDSKSRLWVTTRTDGFYVFDPINDTVFHYMPDIGDPHSLSFNGITHIIEEGKDVFWIGTLGGGLNRFNFSAKTFKHYKNDPDNPNTIPSDYIIQLKKDKDNNIWIATWNGLVLLNPQIGKMHTYQHDPNNQRSISSNEVWRILQDNQGRIWVGTGNGLNLYNKNSNDFLRFYNDPLNPASLSNNAIISLFQEDNKTLWVATANGLNKLDVFKNQFSFYFLRIDPVSGKENPFEGVMDILQDSRGLIWMATLSGGIYKYDPVSQSLRLYKLTRGEANRAQNIVEDSDGGLWVTTVAGLLKYNPQKDAFYDYFSTNRMKVPLVDLLAIFEDSKQRLWLGTRQGVFVKQPNIDTFSFISDKPKAGFCIMEDSKGKIWVTSEGDGIGIFNEQLKLDLHIKNESNKRPILLDNFLLNICEDAAGNYWIATIKGIDQLTFVNEKPVVKHWTMADLNLPDDRMEAIRVDSHGRIWGITRSKVLRLNPVENSVAVYSHFLKSEDLFSNQISKLNNGHFAIGGYWGIYTFHPDSLKLNGLPPPISITEFRLFNQPVPIRGSFQDTMEWESPLTQSIVYTERIDLPYWQNDFGFEFAALNYTQPERNLYKYKLEGYNDDWILTTADRAFAYYTNITPGKYIFKVIGSNNDGVWNETGKSIFIVVHPPWWATWWAYTLYAILLISGIYYIYQFQLNKKLAEAEAVRLQELDTFKTKLYTNITHEFRTPLTIILGMTDQLRNQVSEHVKENLQIIKRNGRQLLKLVNQMLDLSKLESRSLKLDYEQGEIINYLQYLMESFHSLAGSKDIRLHFMSDLKKFYMDYDPVRLMHVLSNLLSNAIKFTPEGKDVYIAVDVVNKTNNHQYLHIKVKDTGIGIPEEKLPYIFDRFYQVDDSVTRKGEGTGIGLTLAKELVKLMDGEITVKSKLGKGSEFMISLPVTRNYPIKEKKREDYADPIIETPVEPIVVKQDAQENKPLMLLVEDNPDLVKYLVNSFNASYNLEIAYNGQQGIDKALSLIPDIIITDIMMPEKDGFELCDTLKNNTLTSHIPIIMLTAKVDVESRLLGLQRGADAYLAKPFVQEELHVRASELIKQRQRLQAYYRVQAGIADVPQEETPSKEDATIEHAFLSKVNRLIEARLNDPELNVESLSDALFVSNSKLLRKIKALTGVGPNQYIRSFRLAKAKKLLQDNNQSITAIALETGFTDPDYFSRIFKKETGITPTEYRDSL